MAKRLGVVQHAFARPLFEAISSRGSPAFELVTGSSTDLAVKLRNKDVDAAFLSPIDVARDSSSYRILPGLAAASEGKSDAAVLLFHENARAISTVAADPGCSGEIVLTHLVLVEKFGTVPTLVPTSLAPLEALAKADAVLAVGDPALALREKSNKVDLAEEWMDITELPFVHGVWAAREDVLTREEMDAIVSAGRRGAALIEGSIGREGSEYFARFRYDLTERAQTSLTEFIRMAYYHGILTDIPDLRFFPESGNGQA